MSNIQVFNNNEFGQIRTIDNSGKTLFCGSDVAKALGYINPSDALKRHCKGVVKHDTLTPGGIQTLSFINEGDLYRLIVNSKLPSAEKFELWVFDDVLPSIRNYGLYAKDELLNNPDLFIAALQQLKAEREHSKELMLISAVQKQQIAELKPKASYYDLILQNKDTVPITQIAKDYGMSGRAFNKMLHELGIQYKLRETWLLYQEYANQGYTQSRTHAIDAERSVMHTCWTQKGRLFLYDLLRSKRDLLPVIERGAL